MTPQYDNPYAGIVDYEYLLYLQHRACEEELADDCIVAEDELSFEMDGGDGEPADITADDVLRALFDEIK